VEVHHINRYDTGALMSYSFEETVYILLDVTVYAEADLLRGVLRILCLDNLLLLLLEVVRYV
jgi:hypothetical protein